MRNENVMMDRLGEVFGNYLGYACGLILRAFHENEIEYNDLIHILKAVLVSNPDPCSAQLAVEIYNEVCDL